MAGKLVACPACAEYVHASEPRCPHCDAHVRDGGGQVLGRTAGAVLMGLALTACPASDDTDDTAGTSASTSSGTTNGPGSSSEGTTSDPTDVTTSALYGGPATGELPTSSSSTGDSSSTGGPDTDGTSSGTAGDTGSTSLGPDYGVPSTSE